MTSSPALGTPEQNDWAIELRARGYSILSDLLTPRQLDTLRGQLPDALALDANVGTVKSRAITQLFLRSWSSTAIIRDVFLEPRVQWILSHFHVRSFIEHSKLLVKAPGGPETPWHQDHAFFHPFDPESSMLSFWIALDRVDRHNGCLQVVPMSHRRGLLEHRDLGKSGEKEIVHPLAEADLIKDVELEPGDAVVFHSRLLHRAHANSTNQPRFSFKFVCQDLLRRTPRSPFQRSAVNFDGPTGLLNRILPCATARLQAEAHEMRRQGSEFRQKLRSKVQ